MEPTGQATPNESLLASKPPGPATSIHCKHCNRHVATISIDDGVFPVVSQAQACAFCEPFLGLRETLQSREQEHTALLDRGPKHHGRALAHERFRNARVALENFLISIEAPHEAVFDVAQAAFANGADHTQPVPTDNTAQLPKPDVGQRNSREASPETERVTPTNFSPVAKRRSVRDAGAENLERKRIKFTECVEERSEYRSTSEFHRVDKEYIPGRYVVAEGSEYLDTSGLGLTFAKFTGQKKVGSMFVDLVPKEEPQDWGDDVPAVKSKGTGNHKRKQEGQEAVENGRKDLKIPESTLECETDNDQTNSRESKSARRSRSTTPPVVTRSRRKIAQHDGQDDQAGAQLELSRVAILKTSYPVKEGMPADERGSNNAPEHEEDVRDLSHEDDPAEAMRVAAELARINQVVTNLERELIGMQQAVVTPRYTHKVSTAVSGILKALTPLKELLETRPVENAKQEEEAEDVIDDDSIYFDAIDAIARAVSGDVSQSAEALEKPEHSQIRADTAGHFSEMGEVYEGLTLDAKELDDVPVDVQENMHTPSASVTAEHEHEHDQQSLGLSVRVGLEEAPENTTDEGVAGFPATHRRGSSEPDGLKAPDCRILSAVSTTRRSSRKATPRPNGAFSYAERPVQKDAETQAGVQLRDLFRETFRDKSARDLDQSVGELINEHIETKGAQAQRESEASSGSPSVVDIDQNPGAIPAGSGEQPEVHIANTDRCGAEAQTDSDTASTPAQVETIISGRDLSADHAVEGDMESLDEQTLHDNEHLSRTPRDLSVVGDELKIDVQTDEKVTCAQEDANDSFDSEQCTATHECH